MRREIGHAFGQEMRQRGRWRGDTPVV